MKSFIQACGLAFMSILLFYRLVITALFLPLAGSFRSPDGAYFVLLVIVQALATLAAYKRKRLATGVLSLTVSVTALSFWYLIMRNSQQSKESDFVSLCLPELIFGVAGLLVVLR